LSRAAVVILNWNKAELTRQCLATAKAATSEQVDWILVDNGSSPPLPDPEHSVTLLRHRENLGFAGGVNTGLRHAFAHGAQHVLLLNNDAKLTQGALDTMLALVRENPKIGLASPTILNEDAGLSIEFCGGMWRPGEYHTTADPAQYQTWVTQFPKNIWLVGTALLVSRLLIEKIGYFDEEFFAYWEDNDICRRASRAGFLSSMVEDAKVHHHGGKLAISPLDRPPYYYYLMARNEIRLLRKTGDIQDLRLLYWALARQWRLWQRLQGFNPQRAALRRGVIDGILGRGGRYRAT